LRPPVGTGGNALSAASGNSLVFSAKDALLGLYTVNWR
jgi:hypothetical protein